LLDIVDEFMTVLVKLLMCVLSLCSGLIIIIIIIIKSYYGAPQLVLRSASQYKLQLREA